MTKNTPPEARLFYADTRFERLARRSGGVEREKAIEQAQAQVEEMKADFSVWIDNEFDTLNAALSEIESDPSNKGALERAHRSCAQLRDVGGTMGYQLVTFVAKTLCEILEAYIAGAAYDTEVIVCHTDAFKLARLEQYRHLEPHDVPEMAAGLLRVVELASIIPPEPGK
jgi:hypothetical protein